ncbi:hypothetical protein M9Y10_034508 [Tritrichomonas musculus]|uniref:PPM-type phosphatase domain-containing protein n=1 Tax=Tritrichomonas musculus TaxID=1915356 RepID=A0ABR2KF56_9EUKA
MSQIRLRKGANASHFIISGKQLFSGGHAETRGKRTTMEDRCAIIGEFAGEDTQFYGIFDGHGGSDCSTYVANNLYKIIAEKLISNDMNDVLEIIQESIDEINAYAVEKWMNQGTTVAIAIIIKNKLYTANVGDSRILLVNRNDKIVKRLSVDHKVSDPIEQERIKAKLGLIQNDRVGGILALSRSIGDGCLSDFISCEAYMTENEYTYDQGLILACDGVWDVIDDIDAAQIFRSADNAANASNLIKQSAIDNRTTDNVAVVCVNLIPKALAESAE